MSDAPAVSLVVSLVDESSADAERLDATTRQLRQRLAELDIESVELASGGAAPTGAKSGEAVALGTLLVTLLPATLPKVLDFLQSWMLRDAGHAVKIRATAGDRTVEVEYAPGSISERQLKDLVASISSGLAAPTGNA
jgi:hypothetical protein